MFPTARHASYLKTPQFLLDNVPCHTKSLILFKSPKRNTLWLQKSINHLEIAFWDLSSTGSGPMKVDRAPAEGDVCGGRFQESCCHLSRDTNQAYYVPSKGLPHEFTARTRPSACRTQQWNPQKFTGTFFLLRKILRKLPSQIPSLQWALLLQIVNTARNTGESRKESSQIVKNIKPTLLSSFKSWIFNVSFGYICIVWKTFWSVKRSNRMKHF